MIPACSKSFCPTARFPKDGDESNVTNCFPAVGLAIFFNFVVDTEAALDLAVVFGAAFGFVPVEADALVGLGFVVDDDVVLVIIVVALSVVPLDGAELVVVACVSVAFFVVAFVVVSLCACMSWCRCSVPSRQSVAVPRCHCRRVTLSSLCRPW